MDRSYTKGATHLGPSAIAPNGYNLFTRLNAESYSVFSLYVVNV